MRDYRHMMEQVTLSDQKKEDIMNMIENKQTKKRGVPLAGKLVLAAALAAGCLLSAAAAGLPGKVYSLFTGGSVILTDGQAWLNVDMQKEPDSPVEVRDGRLWFIADGQEIDITDLVDEETPYIYTGTNADTGEKRCIAAGGTPENFGWAEWIKPNNGTNLEFMISDKTGIEYYVTSDGEYIPVDGVDGRDDPRWEELYVYNEDYDHSLPPEYGWELRPGVRYEFVYYPWMEAAASETGIRLSR